MGTLGETKDRTETACLGNFYLSCRQMTTCIGATTKPPVSRIVG
jgi:hypothetical protein